MATLNPEGGLLHELNTLFAYKAEWLHERLFEVFTEPSYFPGLTTRMPTVLVGGRGTGKTTVLRGLSYEGAYALSGASAESVSGWPYYGFYVRVDTNKVEAFKGPEVTTERWTRLFAHYLNLLLCDRVLGFLAWYEAITGSKVALPAHSCVALSESLCLSNCTSHTALRDEGGRALRLFETYINNIADDTAPRLSMQGAPLELLMSELRNGSTFSGKTFFFCLDEFENLQDYQQRVVNTLIKHASTDYTFKIGVRELGWRQRTTLNPHEQLHSPADFSLIRITDELECSGFPEFAKKVCAGRLKRIHDIDELVVDDIDHFLPSLSLAAR